MPALLLVLPLIVMPLALGVASGLALRPPPMPDTAAPDVEPKASEPARLYVPLRAPVNISLPGGGDRLKIVLTLALEAKAAPAIEDLLKKRAHEVQTGLAETALRTAERLGTDLTPVALRAALPEPLRKTINARLETLGEAPAVLEVLITDWALAP